MSLHDHEEGTDHPLRLHFLWREWADRIESRVQTPDSLYGREQTPVIAKAEPVESRAEGSQTTMEKEQLANEPISRSDRQSPCAVRDQIPSHDSSNDESDTMLFALPFCERSASHRPESNSTPITSRSPSLLKEKGSGSSTLAPSCPSPTLIAFTAPPLVVQVEKTPEGTSKRKRKRSAVGRKSEQRRSQTMASQKKYRDKRLHAGELMSESIVQIQVALDRLAREPLEECMYRIQYFMNQYRLDMEGLDPNLLAKQDKAINNQNF